MTQNSENHSHLPNVLHIGTVDLNNSLFPMCSPKLHISTHFGVNRALSVKGSYCDKSTYICAYSEHRQLFNSLTVIEVRKCFLFLNYRCILFQFSDRSS